jgi:hypothetical protein
MGGTHRLCGPALYDKSPVLGIRSPSLTCTYFCFGTIVVGFFVG